MGAIEKRFTLLLRSVLQQAEDEARFINHEYVGTEHLLTALTKVDKGAVAKVLKNLNVSLREIRLEVAKLMQPGETRVEGELSKTPRAKKAIEYAVEEARAMNHNYVGTEDLLIGLMRENDGVAAQVLLGKFHLTLEDVREEIRRVLKRVGGGPMAIEIMCPQEDPVPDIEDVLTGLLADAGYDSGYLPAFVRALDDEENDFCAGVVFYLNRARRNLHRELSFKAWVALLEGAGQTSDQLPILLEALKVDCPVKRQLEAVLRAHFEHKQQSGAETESS